MITTPSLQYIYRYNPATRLCLREDTGELFIAKEISADSLPVYRALTGLSCPVLPTIREIRPEDDTLLVIRDYVAGKSLAAHLDAGKRFSTGDTARIGRELCDGLNELHKRGLVHRDICPNNIILSPDGHVHIIDFGITRSFLREKNADTCIIGTPGYAAPEQFGFTQSDAKTDIYALGVLMTVMLTGAMPGEGAPVSGKMGKILRRCMAIDANRRYDSVNRLKEALSPFALSSAYGRGDRLLAGIPGLRSRHTPVVILSALFYIAAFIFIGAAMSRTERGTLLITDAIFIFLFMIFPFCCFFDAGFLWERFPLTAGSSRRTQRILFWILGFVSMLVGAIVLGSAYAAAHT